MAPFEKRGGNAKPGKDVKGKGEQEQSKFQRKPSKRSLPPMGDVADEEGMNEDMERGVSHYKKLQKELGTAPERTLALSEWRRKASAVYETKAKEDGGMPSKRYKLLCLFGANRMYIRCPLDNIFIFVPCRACLFICGRCKCKRKELACECHSLWYHD